MQDGMEKNILKTGTTTVGIICKDGVILAADRRMSAGYMIAGKKTEKINVVFSNKNSRKYVNIMSDVKVYRLAVREKSKVGYMFMYSPIIASLAKRLSFEIL